jgi:hypothetical protein
MKTLRPKGPAIVGIAVACVAASGLAAYAAASSGGEPTASEVEQFTKVAPGPGRALRESGLSASNATPAFTLPDGSTVSTVTNGATTCLVRSVQGHDGATCASPAGIAEGHGISVSDECGTGGDNRMEIIGLAPNGAQNAVLRSSDGTTQSTAVVSGAFMFDATNPAPGAPYPKTVEWLGATGGTMGAAALPVKGDDFCG